MTAADIIAHMDNAKRGLSRNKWFILLHICAAGQTGTDTSSIDRCTWTGEFDTIRNSVQWFIDKGLITRTQKKRPSGAGRNGHVLHATQLAYDFLKLERPKA